MTGNESPEMGLDARKATDDTGGGAVGTIEDSGGSLTPQTGPYAGLQSRVGGECGPWSLASASFATPAGDDIICQVVLSMQKSRGTYFVSVIFDVLSEKENGGDERNRTAE